MDLDLTGRHALVLGASKGIGRATATALSTLGADLTLLARDGSLLEQAADAARAMGAPSVRVLVANLDDRAGLEATLRAHLGAHGPVHVVIHNTGGPPGGPLIDATSDALLEAFSRHVLTAQLVMRLVLPGMRASNYGRWVNVLSTSVREPIDNLGVSNVVRAAMASWAKTLSRELPPGVTINNVLPGYTSTERLHALAEGVAQRTGKPGDQVRAEWRAMVPEARFGTPEELAAVIAFLTSPAAGYVRGVSLPVDGGRLRSI